MITLKKKIFKGHKTNANCGNLMSDKNREKSDKEFVLLVFEYHRVVYYLDKKVFLMSIANNFS